jgi:hypothetical protein
VPIRAQLGNDTGATRVFLFYRGGGQEDYVSVPLRHTSGAEWVGAIPGEALVGRALQYYLEARDARGRAVVGSGSAPNPYIITISDTAAAPAAVPEVDVEDPLLRERLRKQREEEERAVAPKRDHLFVFVMPGFGFGVQPTGNRTEVAWQFQTPPAHYVPEPVASTGFAIAPFHLAIEVGGMITPAISLSLVGRFQLVTGANAETQHPVGTDVTNPTSKASGAVAGFVRARYRFLSGKFHPYVHLDVGGGQIRHALDISSADSDAHPLVDSHTAGEFNADSDPNKDPNDPRFSRQRVCPMSSCVDTIQLGYLFLGGGAGLWYDFARHFAFIVDVDVLGAIGVGSGQSGLDIDLNVGIGAHFL